MDINSTCRVCLDQLDLNDGVNIFETAVDDGNLLSTCFQLLFNFEVNPDDQLPPFICPKCKLGIELSFSLRKQAIESNETLLNNQETSQDNNEYQIITEETILPNDDYSNYVELNEEDDTGSSDNTDTDAVSFLLGKIKDKKSTEPAEEGGGDDKRKFQCTVCEKRFLKRTNLVDHLKIHAGVKNYRCSICDRSFIQYGNLKAHMRCHTKQKPFKCEICGKSYTQSSALKIHMRSHTNERSYICDFCGKGFTNSSDLGKHKKIHDPVKDYTCKECQQQFTQKVHAKKHIKKLHPFSNIDLILVKRS